VVPAAAAASCAFMLPVVRAGALMNILGSGVIIAVSQVTLRGARAHQARAARHRRRSRLVRLQGRGT